MATAKLVEFSYLTTVYDFLNSISVSNWTTFKYLDETTGAKDALGHYGCREKAPTPEGVKLGFTFRKYGLNISDINDGFDSNYTQPTPKARVLAAIDTIRAILWPEYFE